MNGGQAASQWAPHPAGLAYLSACPAPTQGWSTVTVSQASWCPDPWGCLLVPMSF